MGIPGSQGDTGLQGETGVVGAPGPQGEIGPQGYVGPQGDPGTPGIQGIPGEQGPPGIDGEQGVQGVPGAKGDTGSQGIQGAPGDTGPPGAKGDAGDQGIQGIQGVPGVQGDVGLQGPTGPAGPPTPQVVVLASDVAAMAWTNMPVALTEFRALALNRTKLDLTNCTQARLVVRQTIAGATNAQLKLHWAAVEDVSWADVCVVAIGAGTGTKAGTWTNIPTGAKADVFVRLVGISGDAAADPAFGLVALQLK